jgi:hypothetical protein
VNISKIERIVAIDPPEGGALLRAG